MLLAMSVAKRIETSASSSCTIILPFTSPLQEHVSSTHNLTVARNDIKHKTG